MRATDVVKTTTKSSPVSPEVYVSMNRTRLQTESNYELL